MRETPFHPRTPGEPSSPRRSGRTWLVSAALVGLALVLVGANPPPTAFVELGPSLGLTGKGLGSYAPVWLDLDLDGSPEPAWASYDGVVYLEISDTGEAELKSASADKHALKSAARPTLALATMDFDDDGVEDLLASGRETNIHRVKEGVTLKVDKFPLPSLPGVTVFDIAVGDLNADGLPDMVLALAILASERLIRRGYPDVVLMNIGHGRFEAHTVEPAREDFSNGLSLADVDGDRRPDLVESINYSLNVGGSRILFNRTPPGARVPVFEASEHEFDTGTHGMGATIADLNQDGYMDIYNTSVGLDQLSMGQPDGSFVDESFERGVFHLWGDAGLRSQWSPTFVDLNIDGRLDILVRQGGFGGSFGLQAMGPGPSDTGKDVLYLQREDGTLTRDFVPYTAVSGSMGRQAVIGDVDDDGRPDVSFGGGGGSANFWHNQTPVPEGGRVLTVRVKPTLTASPAIGTWVKATCGDQTLSRHLTSGGKMGGHAASDVYFAWLDCASEVTVQVGWGSGATTEHQVPAGQTLVAPEEPLWWQASEELPGHVRVDPGSIGADEICVQPDPASTWDCCAAADGPCDLALSEDLSARPIGRVDQAEPVALMDRSSTWMLMANPDPLIPGEEAELRLLHLGDPDRFMESEPSVFVGEPWEYIMDVKLDEDRQTRRLTIDIPEGIVELPVSIFCDADCPSVIDQYPQVTWILPAAGSFDPQWSKAQAYPYLVTGGETEFWEWTAYVMGIRGISKPTFFEHTQVQKLDGTVLEYTSVQSTVELSRVRINVKWEDLVGVDELRLVDDISGQSFELPVRGPYDLEEAVARIDNVGEGMVWHRLAAHGDLCPIAMELMDAEGNTLSPEAEMITLEADGAEVVQQPVLRSGTFDLYGLIRTQDCEASGGEVRVVAADGRVISEHPFLCRPEGLPELSLEHSWATLSAIEDVVLSDPQAELHTQGATHVLRVHAHNPHDESLGADARVELHIEGGEIVGPKLLSAYGDLNTPIAADPGQHTMVVDVVVNGISLDTLSVDVDIPLPVEDVTAPDVTDVVSEDLGPSPDAGPVADSTPTPPSGGGGGGGGGCSGGSAGEPNTPWWMAPILMAFLCRRRWSLS